MALFTGFSFPFRKGASSFPEVATDNDLIKQSLIQLVLTGAGERLMRPNVGSSAFAYIFEDNDDLLQNRAEADISVLVNTYEPRVALLGVQVVRGNLDLESEATTITITLSYVVLATRQSDKADITLTSTGG